MPLMLCLDDYDQWLHGDAETAAQLLAPLLAEMLGFVADRLMALDVDQQCGAGTHERSTERVNHRNGYRKRRWETRVYDAELISRAKPVGCPVAINSATRRR